MEFNFCIVKGMLLVVLGRESGIFRHFVTRPFFKKVNYYNGNINRSFRQVPRPRTMKFWPDINKGGLTNLMPGRQSIKGHLEQIYDTGDSDTKR